MVLAFSLFQRVYSHRLLNFSIEGYIWRTFNKSKYQILTFINFSEDFQLPSFVKKQRHYIVISNIYHLSFSISDMQNLIKKNPTLEGYSIICFSIKMRNFPIENV